MVFNLILWLKRLLPPCDCRNCCVFLKNHCFSKFEIFICATFFTAQGQTQFFQKSDLIGETVKLYLSYIYIYNILRGILLFTNMDYVYLSKMFANFNPCIIYLEHLQQLCLFYLYMCTIQQLSIYFFRYTLQQHSLFTLYSI